MTDLAEIVDKAINYFPAFAIGIGVAATHYWWRTEKPKINEERQRLYRDIEKIPTEHQPAVLQLLHDLREGSPQRAGYRIDHLLGKYKSIKPATK